MPALSLSVTVSEGVPRKSEQDRMVDELLGQLPHANPSLEAEETSPEPAAPSRAPVTQGTMVGRSTEVERPSTWSVWVRTVTAVALGAALPFWPYARDCGWPLAGYGALVAGGIGAGLWAGVFSWRGRQGIAHTLSIAALAWCLVLAAGVTLPRVGYAAQSASWACQVEPPAAPTAPAGSANPIPVLDPMVVTDTAVPLDSM